MRSRTRAEVSAAPVAEAIDRPGRAPVAEATDRGGHLPVAGATDRPATGATDRRGRLRFAALLSGRLAAAGLTVAMAAVHYHLWSTGYRHVPTIGDLFLLNAIVGVALGAALLVVARRLLAATAALTALFIAGTLGALILSLHVGLFGFREFAGAPFLDESYVIESAGIVVAAVLAIVSRSRNRNTRRLASS